MRTTRGSVGTFAGARHFFWKALRARVLGNPFFCFLSLPLCSVIFRDESFSPLRTSGAFRQQKMTLVHNGKGEGGGLRFALRRAFLAGNSPLAMA